MTTDSTALDRYWRPALRKLIPVPDGYRRPTVGRAQAAKDLGCPAEILDELVAAGLPADDDPSGPLFDYHDVMNLGRLAGTGRSLAEMGERRLMRLAAGTPESWLAERSWRLSLTASCGRPECATPVALIPPTPGLYGGALTGWQAADSAVASSVATVITRGQRAEPTNPAIRDIFDELLSGLYSGRYRYSWLPHELRVQQEIAFTNGTLDCVLAAELMLRWARQANLVAFSRNGFLLGAVGVQHAWLEVYEDGRRLIIDPILAYLASGYADSQPEFTDFCCGSVPNRILAWQRSADEPLAEHICTAGAEASVTCRSIPNTTRPGAGPPS